MAETGGLHRRAGTSGCPDDPRHPGSAVRRPGRLRPEPVRAADPDLPDRDAHDDAAAEAVRLDVADPDPPHAGAVRVLLRLAALPDLPGGRSAAELARDPGGY